MTESVAIKVFVGQWQKAISDTGPAFSGSAT
jgi:hypothetical protein